MAYKLQLGLPAVITTCLALGKMVFFGPTLVVLLGGCRGRAERRRISTRAPQS